MPIDPQYRNLIETQHAELYNYCFRMCLEHVRAQKVFTAVVQHGHKAWNSMTEAEYPQGEAKLEWLLRLAGVVLEQELDRQPEVSFDLLDDTLRSEATRTDLVRSLTEPKRDFLLWDLKQGCMTAVVNCLSPGERSAFVMAHVMGLTDEAAARISGISKSAYKVRISRAQQKVKDFLAPRCEHVDPRNPCRCPARLGQALDRGFIRHTGEVNLRPQLVPFGRYGVGDTGEDEPLRDISKIYSKLPNPELSRDFLEQVWQTVEKS